MRHCGRSRRGDHGFTLIEILIAVVLVGVLSAVAVVGISNLVGKSANAACTASADAARAASAVYLTSHAAYPVDLAALITPTGAGATLIPAALTMPTGVAVTGVVATSSAGHWTLTMTPGSVGVAPTFACATTSAAAATTTTTTLVAAIPVATTVPAAVCPGRFRALRAGWRGEYFGTADLSGPPVLCRDDATIDFDWRDGSPSADVPKDAFSVRWSRTETLTEGDHTFTLAADDGSRLFVDGELVLDRWDPEKAREIPPTVTVTLTAGKHTFVVEYHERDELASVSLRTAVGSGAGRECPIDPVGWLGEYFADGDVAGRPTVCRDDAGVDFDWADGAPLDGMPTDKFAVRWTRTQVFEEGAYTFILGSDDGGRLFVDGKLVIDAWSDQLFPEKPPGVTMDLGRGEHTVVVEYYDATGPARVALTVTPST